jgi:hypothetical protein
MYTLDAGRSGSIAIIASSIDSALDVLSQFTLLLTNNMMKKSKWRDLFV